MKTSLKFGLAATALFGLAACGKADTYRINDAEGRDFTYVITNAGICNQIVGTSKKGWLFGLFPTNQSMQVHPVSCTDAVLREVNRRDLERLREDGVTPQI